MATELPTVERRFAPRVDCLDWLRVLAVFGVFVFHTLRPFDADDWNVKNAAQSEALSLVLIIVASWGLAFFFLLAGAGTFLALRWRSTGRYVRERLTRLLIPLVAVWVLLGPVQYVLEVRHHGRSSGSLRSDVSAYLTDVVGDPPLLLAGAYHLWFLVFLLEFSLLGLPFFAWLRSPRGARAMARLGELGERRGAILLLAAPVVVVSVALGTTTFGGESDHGWWQFGYFFAFFLIGHLVMAEPRLVAAVRRDLVPALAAGAGGVVLLFVIGMPRFIETWDGSFTLWYVAGFSLITVQAWGWILTLWGLGMRAAAFQRPLPRTIGAAAMPYFLIHQPVIVAIAFVVVQWQAGIPVKWLAIAVPSALVTAALAVAVTRVPVVGVLFGVKPERRAPVVPVRG